MIRIADNLSFPDAAVTQTFGILAVRGAGKSNCAAVMAEQTMVEIVRVLIKTGAPLSREELAEQLSIHPNGGRYGSNLAWLRTMGIITERGPITVTEGLYR